MASYTVSQYKPNQKRSHNTTMRYHVTNMARGKAGSVMVMTVVAEDAATNASKNAGIRKAPLVSGGAPHRVALKTKPAFLDLIRRRTGQIGSDLATLERRGHAYLLQGKPILHDRAASFTRCDSG